MINAFAALSYMMIVMPSVCWLSCPDLSFIIPDPSCFTYPNDFYSVPDRLVRNLSQLVRLIDGTYNRAANSELLLW